MLSKLAPVQSNFSAAMNQGVIREDYLTAPFGQLLRSRVIENFEIHMDDYGVYQDLVLVVESH
jgi:hypothetical protein